MTEEGPFAQLAASSEEMAENFIERTGVIAPGWQELTDQGFRWFEKHGAGLWTGRLTADQTRRPELYGALMIMAKLGAPWPGGAASTYVRLDELKRIALGWLARLTDAQREARLLTDKDLVQTLMGLLPDIPGLGGTGAQAEAQGGSHASPRPHARRGHWRRTRSGGRTWVRPARIGGQALDEVRLCGQCANRRWGQCQVARAWVGVRVRAGLCPHWVERDQTAPGGSSAHNREVIAA